MNISRMIKKLNRSMIKPLQAERRDSPQEVEQPPSLVVARENQLPAKREEALLPEKARLLKESRKVECKRNNERHLI
jgi:hypothetical protein